MTKFGYRLVRLAGFAALAGIIGSFTFVSSATAGETQISGRYIDQKADSSWVKVGDVDGHIVGSFQKQGVVHFDNEEVATRNIAGTFDYTKGVGPHEGYTINTFKDGSTYLFNWAGTTKYNEEKVRVHEGTFSCVRGTGRFKDIKCEGTYITKSLKNGMSAGKGKGTRTLPD